MAALNRHVNDIIIIFFVFHGYLEAKTKKTAYEIIIFHQ